ncbi:PD-(D/E)XK motif protein [Roseomonas mucosa]
MVALSAAGRPGLLLRTAAGGPRPGNIRLSGMNATFGVNCTIAVGDGPPDERRMSILECTADADAVPLFAESAGTFLRLLGEAPTMAEAAVAVARFASIFSSLTRPSRQSVTGLIGELMLLLLASDPAGAIGCWRVSPNDRFDFVGSDARVECKATSGGARVHSFSWEQCSPPDGATLAASIRVESAGGGMSVSTLLDRIEARLLGHPDAAARLRETVASTMGRSLPQVLGTTFDEALCRTSLLWFDLRDIPAIRGDLPPGVSGLRFSSDLSGAQPVSPMLLAETSLAPLIPLT